MKMVPHTRSEGSLRPASQILRFAQDDKEDLSQVHLRESYLQMSRLKFRSNDTPQAFKKDVHSRLTEETMLNASHLKSDFTHTFSSPNILHFIKTV